MIRSINFIGLTLKEASRLLGENPNIRVVCIDDQWQDVPEEFFPGRFSVHLNNDIITQCTCEGGEPQLPKPPPPAPHFLIGHSFESAQRKIEGTGITLRIASIDGQPKPKSLDGVKADRYNVTLIHGIIHQCIPG